MTKHCGIARGNPHYFDPFLRRGKTRDTFSVILKDYDEFFTKAVSYTLSSLQKSAIIVRMV